MPVRAVFGGDVVSADPVKADLEAKIVAASRRWYASTNESELAGLVAEYERLLRKRAAVPMPTALDETAAVEG